MPILAIIFLAGLSIPSTPEHIPNQNSKPSDGFVDVNSNQKEQMKCDPKSDAKDISLIVEKDFQDKRKPDELKDEPAKSCVDIKISNKVVVDCVCTEEINTSEAILETNSKLECLSDVSSQNKAKVLANETNLDLQPVDTSCDEVQDGSEQFEYETSKSDSEFGQNDTSQQLENTLNNYGLTNETEIESISSNHVDPDIGDENSKTANDVENNDIQTEDDEFCDFDSFTVPKIKKTVEVMLENNENTFETTQPSTVSVHTESVVVSDPLTLNVDNLSLSDDGFGDFENHFDVQIPSEEADHKTDENCDDDFGDFENCTFEAQPFNPTDKCSVEIEFNEEDGDFGDFDVFPTCSASKTFLLTDKSEDVLIRAEKIIKDFFPVVPVEAPVWENVNFLEKDGVFNLLKDITDTNGLKLQWIGSGSQKALLKSLNIDMRNIVSRKLYHFWMFEVLCLFIT